MTRAIILGAGPSGLIAAHYLRQKGVSVVVISDRAGEYDAGGLKYLHDRDGTKALLTDLGIGWEVEPVVGQVLWEGRTYPWPTNNARLNRHLQQSHWAKTRGDTPYSPKCMNIEAAAEGRGRIKPQRDWLKDLATRAADVSVIGSPVASVLLEDFSGHVRARTADGQEYTADLIVNTIPLPVFHQACYAKPWAGRHQSLIVLRGLVAVRPEWDYIYLPEGKYTAHRAARVARATVDVEVQAPAGVGLERLPTEAFWREAEAVVPGFMGESMAILKGHLLPTSPLPTFPSQAHSLGRYAEWRDKVMVHDVVLKAKEIADEL